MMTSTYHSAPQLEELERDLRVALTLKADDLWYTVGGSKGAAMQAALLGVQEVGGLATDAFTSEEALAEIDIEQLDITLNVRALWRMTSERALSTGSRPGEPNGEDARHEHLDFLESFISAIPTVALGGWDPTSVRVGALARLYRASAAWIDFVHALDRLFHDGNNGETLRVGDLAELSGLELRSVRNVVGPTGKPVRSTPERRLDRTRSGLTDPSFVSVNTLDAIDWLVGRRGFRCTPIDPRWAERRLASMTTPQAVGRTAVVLGWINTGPSAVLAARLGWSVESVRQWAEQGPGTIEDAAKLAEVVGLGPDTYAAACGRALASTTD